MISARRAIDVVLEFIACINRGDVDGLGRLMSDDHELCVFDESPVRGRDANVAAWRGYATSFPDYTIRVHRIVQAGDRVAVLGATTGSHLGLPDDEEGRQTLIWVAHVDGDVVRAWRLVDDTAAHRRELGLEASSEPRK